MIELLESPILARFVERSDAIIAIVERAERRSVICPRCGLVNDHCRCPIAPWFMAAGFDRVCPGAFLFLIPTPIHDSAVLILTAVSRRRDRIAFADRLNPRVSIYGSI